MGNGQMPLFRQSTTKHRDARYGDSYDPFPPIEPKFDLVVDDVDKTNKWIVVGETVGQRNPSPISQEFAFNERPNVTAKRLDDSDDFVTRKRFYIVYRFNDDKQLGVTNIQLNKPENLPILSIKHHAPFLSSYYEYIDLDILKSSIMLEGKRVSVWSFETYQLNQIGEYQRYFGGSEKLTNDAFYFFDEKTAFEFCFGLPSLLLGIGSFKGIFKPDKDLGSVVYNETVVNSVANSGRIRFVQYFSSDIIVIRAMPNNYIPYAADYVKQILLGWKKANGEKKPNRTDNDNSEKVSKKPDSKAPIQQTPKPDYTNQTVFGCGVVMFIVSMLVIILLVATSVAY